MSTVLVASPSAFLRIGVIQQLRRRQGSTNAMEAATAAEAIRILAANRIDLAIVDDALIAAPAGDGLSAAIERHHGKALIIATLGPCATPRATPTRPVIQGTAGGHLDIGAIARALPAALDQVAVEHGIRPASSRPLARPIIEGRVARPPRRQPELILVAASTGGPSALTLLLHHLGPPRLPVIVAQHMPADQTAGFAQYLAAQSGLDVIERGAGEVPTSAQVTVLRGGSDYRLARGRDGTIRLLATEVAGNVFHPSADLLFGSAAEIGLAVVAVVLSGMGDDGARGAAAVAERGDRVLAQEFNSCVVAGMPSATRALCPSAVVAGVPGIAERLSRWSAVVPRPAAAVGG